MAPVHDRSSEQNMMSAPSPEGPGLDDCRVLIARIDGTMEALSRERARLEARAGRLLAASRSKDAGHGC